MSDKTINEWQNEYPIKHPIKHPSLPVFHLIKHFIDYNKERKSNSLYTSNKPL
jgi:hypothetical protein